MVLQRKTTMLRKDHFDIDIPVLDHGMEKVLTQKRIDSTHNDRNFFEELRIQSSDSSFEVVYGLQDEVTALPSLLASLSSSSSESDSLSESSGHFEESESLIQSGHQKHISPERKTVRFSNTNDIFMIGDRTEISREDRRLLWFRRSELRQMRRRSEREYWQVYNNPRNSKFLTKSYSGDDITVPNSEEMDLSLISETELKEYLEVCKGRPSRTDNLQQSLHHIMAVSIVLDEQDWQRQKKQYVLEAFNNKSQNRTSQNRNQSLLTMSKSDSAEEIIAEKCRLFSQRSRQTLFISNLARTEFLKIRRMGKPLECIEQSEDQLPLLSQPVSAVRTPICASTTSCISDTSDDADVNINFPLNFDEGNDLRE